MDDTTSYQHLVGFIRYQVATTRRYSSHAEDRLSRFMHKPTRTSVQPLEPQLDISKLQKDSTFFCCMQSVGIVQGVSDANRGSRQTISKINK